MSKEFKKTIGTEWTTKLKEVRKFTYDDFIWVSLAYK